MLFPEWGRSLAPLAGSIAAACSSELVPFIAMMGDINQLKY